MKRCILIELTSSTRLFDNGLLRGPVLLFSLCNNNLNRCGRVVQIPTAIAIIEEDKMQYSVDTSFYQRLSLTNLSSNSFVSMSIPNVLSLLT